MERATVFPLRGLPNTEGRAVRSYLKVVPFEFPKTFLELPHQHSVEGIVTTP